MKVSEDEVSCVSSEASTPSSALEERHLLVLRVSEFFFSFHFPRCYHHNGETTTSMRLLL